MHTLMAPCTSDGFFAVVDCVKLLCRHGPHPSGRLDEAITNLSMAMEETLEANRLNYISLSNFPATSTRLGREAMIGVSYTSLVDSIAEPHSRWTPALSSIPPRASSHCASEPPLDKSNEEHHQSDHGSSSSSSNDVPESLAGPPVASARVQAPIRDLRRTRAPYLHATRPWGHQNRSVTRRATSNATSATRLMTPSQINDIVCLVGGTAAFDNFCEAIDSIHKQNPLRLPPGNENIAIIVAFLKSVRGAGSANELFYRTGSWRLLERYREITQERDEVRRGWSSRQNRTNRAGRATSQARTILLIDQDTPRGSEDFQHVQKSTAAKLDNRIESSKIWHAICEVGGPAMVGMFPPLARTRLERVPKASRVALINALQDRPDMVEMASIISPHFEATLEGAECSLAALMSSDMVCTFQDIIKHQDKLQGCCQPHA